MQNVLSGGDDRSCTHDHGGHDTHARDDRGDLHDGDDRGRHDDGVQQHGMRG